MHREGYSTWSVCVCLSVCVFVTQHLTFHVIICATNNTNLSGGWRSNSLSDFLWKCFIAKLELFLLVWLHDKSAIFFSADNALAYESGHVASGHFVLGETFFANSIIAYWQLAVSMPPTKVCLQCKAAVPEDGRHVNTVVGVGAILVAPLPLYETLSEQTESESVAWRQLFFLLQPQNCAITNWSFVVITINTSVHVQVFTVTSLLFTHNCV